MSILVNLCIYQRLLLVLYKLYILNILDTGLCIIVRIGRAKLYKAVLIYSLSLSLENALPLSGHNPATITQLGQQSVRLCYLQRVWFWLRGQVHQRNELRTRRIDEPSQCQDSANQRAKRSRGIQPHTSELGYSSHT